VTRIVIGRFWAPPLFRLQSPLERALNIVAPPLVWGLLCGLLSGVNRSAYLVGLALSISGAFGAGRQQLGAGAGAIRGAIAGTIFGAFVLAGHALAGGGSMLLHPESLQVVFTATIAATFAAGGGWSRRRAEERAGAGRPLAAVHGVAGTEG